MCSSDLGRDSYTGIVGQRTFKVGGAWVAVIALLGLFVLPSPHLHHLESGHALIHSHVVGAPESHPATVEDGDHDDAITINPSFTAGRNANGIAVPVLVSRAVVVSPDTREHALATAVEHPVIHGPPIRSLGLRAPPA